MPGMTAQIAAGTADLWDDGIRPTNLLWLTEDDDYVPLWTLIEVYRAIYGHPPVAPREPTRSTARPIRWLSGHPDRMLRDGLLMLALHVFRIERIVAAAKEIAPGLTASEHLLLGELDQARLAELDEHCMATEFPGKLAVTVLDGSMLHDHLPVLADYKVQLEVCTVTYSHTWGGLAGTTHAESTPVGSLTAGPPAKDSQ
jgi:hypothetical protein